MRVLHSTALICWLKAERTRATSVLPMVAPMQQTIVEPARTVLLSVAPATVRKRFGQAVFASRSPGREKRNRAAEHARLFGRRCASRCNLSKLADFFPLPPFSVAYRFAEEFEEGGGEEGVAEFEGVAPGTAQPVRLLQLSRY